MSGDIERSRELTHAQLLLWTGQQLQPDDPIYNMALAFRIHGAIDVPVFRRAFQHLVDHCDAMRMSVSIENGSPRQRFSASEHSRLEVLDFSMAPNAEITLRKWCEKRVRRQFELDRSLYDSALIRLDTENFVWYLNQHHLITDAWSMAVIFKQLSHYYALAKEDRLGSSSVPSQFRDFLDRERSGGASGALQRAQAYWRQKVAAKVSASRFYGPVTNEPSGRTERVRCMLGAERSKHIRSIAKQSPFRGFTADLSRFRFFCTILLACLHRLSAQSRLVLGIPSHNRGSAALRQTAGMFIELFPLRVEVDDAETLQSLAEKVAGESNQLLMHAVSGAMGFEHRGAYDVVLNYITASFGTFDDIPVESEWIHSGYGDREHRLRLQVQDFDQTAEFSLHFDVSEDCFTPAARGWLVEHFVCMIDAYIEDPQRPLNAIALLNDEQSARQRESVQPPPTPAPQHTIVQHFERQVARSPDRVALRENDVSISYRELDRTSNAVAATLNSQGAGRGSVVAVAIPRSAQAVVAILGILKVGASYLPLELDHPHDRIRYLLENSQVRIALCSAGTGDIINAQALNVIDIDAAMAADPGERSDDAPTLDDTAYVIYTSGSTGQPKGVVVGHRSLANYIEWAVQEYAASAGSSFPLFSPLSFDLTVTSLFVPLVCGGTLVVYPAVEGRREIAIRNVVTDNRVDVVKLTPAHLHLLLDMDFSSSRIRTLIVGGEDFPVELAQSMHRRFGGAVTIYNEYGPTEGTVACMIHRYDTQRDVRASVPIGRAISNLEVYVLDEGGNTLPPGVSGELCIGGAGVALGYLGMPEASAERFVDNPFCTGERMYRSGDLAQWDEYGVLHYLGRADQQVKIRGVRIETAEVEAALQAHPAVSQCIVGVFEDTAHNESSLKACLQCGLEAGHPEASLDTDGVCRLCRDFESQRSAVAAYFGNPQELQAIVDRIKHEATGKHHCLMLLSGGKDSTYALCQIVEMGLNPLVFTLDNGYISEGAKANIRRICDKFELELVVGSPPGMNEIFVDSLNRFSNVCNGCFKTIYTLSTNLAHERGLRTIITGLSRGQIFDTRLAGLRQHQISDRSSVDQTIIEARKAYHRMDDAVARCLDVSVFADDKVFEEIEFIDFYRYADATLEQMLDYLANKAPWIRPSDTGRSTNCLINEAGIHVHKTERGFHNYALPYSWDVRLGHKQRDAAAAELQDEIDVERVTGILNQVGYSIGARAQRKTNHRRLAAWYVGSNAVSDAELRTWLTSKVPIEYVPSSFIAMDALPLTLNDKVDRTALPAPNNECHVAMQQYVAPSSMIEQTLAEIWSGVLGVGQIGTSDSFFDLGGDSILNIQVVSRARDCGIVITPQQVFDCPTISELAQCAQTDTCAVADSGPIKGEVALTPIQRHFFGKYRGKRNEFCQQALLDLHQSADRAQLEDALARLLERHDTLRSRFALADDGNWTQVIESAGAVSAELESADVATLDEAQQAVAIEQLVRKLSSRIDIEAGKCVAAVLIHRGASRHDQLLIVIHNLVVDGVSWWILAHDLEIILSCLAAGREPQFASRSSSWRQWSEALIRFCDSPQLRREIAYWTQPVASGMCLPGMDSQRAGESSTLRIDLDAERTHRLLHQAPAVLRAQVSEVLIAALFEAMAAETGGDTLRIDLEVHGREENIGDLDLLGTVGCFTAIFPVTLQCEGHGDPVVSLRAVKEQLRSVPGHGIGYGLLCHLGADATSAASLAAQPKSALLFNYMGQWERTASVQSTVSLARPVGLNESDPDNQWLSPLCINAVVFDDVLVVHFSYPTAKPAADFVRSLANRFLAVLETLVDACETADETVLAPSDFPYAGIDQGELDDILSDLACED